MPYLNVEVVLRRGEQKHRRRFAPSSSAETRVASPCVRAGLELAWTFPSQNAHPHHLPHVRPSHVLHSQPRPSLDTAQRRGSRPAQLLLERIRSRRRAHPAHRPSRCRPRGQGNSLGQGLRLLHRRHHRPPGPARRGWQPPGAHHLLPPHLRLWRELCATIDQDHQGNSSACGCRLPDRQGPRPRRGRPRATRPASCPAPEHQRPVQAQASKPGRLIRSSRIPLLPLAPCIAASVALLALALGLNTTHLSCSRCWTILSRKRKAVCAVSEPSEAPPRTERIESGLEIAIVLRKKGPTKETKARQSYPHLPQPRQPSPVCEPVPWRCG